MHTVFIAYDRSYLALLKKEIHKLAVDAGFSASKLAHIDIIVAEMGSNLVKHAGGGEILVTITNDDTVAIEIIAVDNGQGIEDVSKMLVDGESTRGTMGTGLGAIKRLSDDFDIYSLKNWGTIVLSRVYLKTPKKKTIALPEIKSLVVAKPGETLSGDACFVKISPKNIKFFLGDGLGHGAEANKVVKEAIKSLKICPDEKPVDMLRFIHSSIKKMRGIVATIAVYDIRAKQWHLCGVGNISTRVLNAVSAKGYMSYNGIIGLNLPNTMNEQLFKPEKGQIIAMCSDGIKSRWEISKYPAIQKADLTILATALYKDFGRRTDDMSVVVGRVI